MPNTNINMVLEPINKGITVYTYTSTKPNSAEREGMYWKNQVPLGSKDIITDFIQEWDNMVNNVLKMST